MKYVEGIHTARIYTLFPVVYSESMTKSMNIPRSCDNAVVLSDVTSSGNLIFGKNSDRPPFECQPIVYGDAKYPPSDATLQLANCELSQPPETSSYKEGIPPFTAGGNPTTAELTTV
ncbi:hypothetical protein [Halegenticoccus tardaugens]|uniref:hypothetical protein n=1 Tax=Halegenticoccus tardaugens TaxID=2071624 RepID=UPI00100A9BE9|nr:hypothetical protein [Halegenticoccus tardaugens]